ncbi:hypothetical protein [Kitasatospora sp. NA04385]|uniref:hypothetical protein n=1 Tax=Kitasatospora sp. NA04385 TaxID=2742135 RepID=UPI001C37820C|nr:hypothetical protein [Kitasatospora sp. NA04385]
MSYELEWVELPEAVAEARCRWESCIANGLPCDHIPDCSESYFSLAGPFQFHLNIAGMAVCRDGLRRSGMSYQAGHQPFPVWPFKDMEDWRSAGQARRDAFNAAERAASAQTVPGKVGIPEFKLLSNGPWLVGGEEIMQALNRYEEASADVRAELETDGLWCDWLGWLRETAGRGGFTVG